MDVRLGIVAQEVFTVNAKMDAVLKLAERVETLEQKVGPMHKEWMARLAVQTWLSGVKGKVIAVLAISGGMLTIAGGAVTLAQAILGAE